MSKSTANKKVITIKQAIRARLLAGQEVARKRRENEYKAKPNGKMTEEIKKVISPTIGDFVKGDTVQ